MAKEVQKMRPYDWFALQLLALFGLPALGIIVLSLYLEWRDTAALSQGSEVVPTEAPELEEPTAIPWPLHEGSIEEPELVEFSGSEDPPTPVPPRDEDS